MSEKLKEEKVEPLKIKKPSFKKIENKEYKVDLTKKPENAVQESSTTKVDVGQRSADGEKVGETHEKQTTAVEGKEEEIKSPITEIVEEKTDELEREVKEAKRDEKLLGKQLPENIEKLVSFMEETGGTVEDYVRLNADYSKVDNDTLLQEYYKQTKPHLDREEINFLLEDKFSFDEDVDDEKEIKLKRLAAKEEIAKAKNFLEETKSKYYDEIKLRPGVTQEQQKAMDFFNRYNKEQKVAEERHDRFVEQTNKIFSDEFKGFEFNLAEKKFHYNVQNTSNVVEKQSNLNTFVKKFLNNEGEVVDAVGYHKAMYASDNADTIANHFYEQGKADALKDVMAKSKNITNEPRPQAGGDVFVNGLKVRAISGADSSKLKFKVKNKNNN